MIKNVVGSFEQREAPALAADSATQVVDSTGVEADLQLPLFNTNDEFLRFVSESEAQQLLKMEVATLYRSRSGKMRRIYLTLSKTLLEQLSGAPSITTDASRTVRRQSLGDTHWCFQHIGQDLAAKRQVALEELAEDGVLPREDK
jgi:hypothetical protein